MGGTRARRCVPLIRLTRRRAWKGPVGPRGQARRGGQFNPIRHLPDQGYQLIIGYNEGEHEEFRRQSKEFAAAWRARGFACQEFDLPDLNHFDVAQQFNNPDSPILKAMFAMIR